MSLVSIRASSKQWRCQSRGKRSVISSGYRSSLAVQQHSCHHCFPLSGRNRRSVLKKASANAAIGCSTAFSAASTSSPSLYTRFCTQPKNQPSHCLLSVYLISLDRRTSDGWGNSVASAPGRLVVRRPVFSVSVAIVIPSCSDVYSGIVLVQNFSL